MFKDNDGKEVYVNAEAYDQALNKALEDEATASFVNGFMDAFNAYSGVTKMINTGKVDLASSRTQNVTNLGISIAVETAGIVVPTGPIGTIVNGITNALFNGHRKKGYKGLGKTLPYKTTHVEILSQALAYGLMLHYGNGLLDAKAKKKPAKSGGELAVALLSNLKQQQKKGDKNKLFSNQAKLTLSKQMKCLFEHILKKDLVSSDNQPVNATLINNDDTYQTLVMFATAELLGLPRDRFIKEEEQKQVADEIQKLLQQHQDEIAGIKESRTRALHETIIADEGSEVMGHIRVKKIDRAAGEMTVGENTSDRVFDRMQKLLDRDAEHAKQAQEADSKVDKKLTVTKPGAKVHGNIDVTEIAYKGLIINTVCAVAPPQKDKSKFHEKVEDSTSMQEVAPSHG